MRIVLRSCTVRLSKLTNKALSKVFWRVQIGEEIIQEYRAILVCWRFHGPACSSESLKYVFLTPSDNIHKVIH